MVHVMSSALVPEADCVCVCMGSILLCCGPRLGQAQALTLGQSVVLFYSTPPGCSLLYRGGNYQEKGNFKFM